MRIYHRSSALIASMQMIPIQISYETVSYYKNLKKKGVAKSLENTVRLIHPPCHPLPFSSLRSLQAPHVYLPCMQCVQERLVLAEELARHRGTSAVQGPIVRAISSLGALQSRRRIGTARARTRKSMGCGWLRRPINEPKTLGSGALPFVRPTVYQMVSSSPVVN